MSKIQIQKQITTPPYRVTVCTRCVWYVKDTNSKANHNIYWAILEAISGVFDMSKIQIQKQITTQRRMFVPSTRCVWYVKDTNSKANHNKDRAIWEGVNGVFDMSKIQIQKQITTRWFLSYIQGTVCLICQRYKFKSKSQRQRCCRQSRPGCVWYVKDTNSKANHNAKKEIINQSSFAEYFRSGYKNVTRVFLPQ